MDWPIARLAATGAGIQVLPAPPSAPILVSDAGASNVFGLYIEFLSAAANTKDRLLLAILITSQGLGVDANAYVAAQIGLGPSSAEVPVAIADIGGIQRTDVGYIMGNTVQFSVPILVRAGNRVAIRTASSNAGNFGHYIKLYYMLFEDLISIGF